MNGSAPDRLRRASAQVAARAAHVRIDAAALAQYARRLEREEGLGPDRPAAASAPPSRELGSDGAPLGVEAREDAAARVLTLDAINFGSGWFPTLAKRPGLSGYRTIAAGLHERFERHGPWTAQQLETLTADELANTLGQDPGHPLIALFLASLRDLGRRVGELRSFTAAVGETAVETVGTLASWECFEDTSRYDELELPFLKRAQIAAADLHRAAAADYAADVHELTIFADNLVPHVLALDGILALDPALRTAIAREQLIEHGSRAEVELRACAVHAAELLVSHLPGVTAAALDAVLWERGGRPFYKASPRPRCRTTAY